MEWITNPEIWIALTTLTVLEIVLGIDNIVFISILSQKLPEQQQKKARQTGLGLALVRELLNLYEGDGHASRYGSRVLARWPSTAKLIAMR